MSKSTRKEMLTILVLTLVFGVGAYFLASWIDKGISFIADLESEIDELTRVATETEQHAQEAEVMGDFSEVLEENLSGIEDLPDMLYQLEVMSLLSGTDLTIKLEEGVISNESVEFRDETEKEEFLKQLEVKEFAPSEDTTTETAQETTNVALTMQQETGETSESRLKINYLEIDVSLNGTYHQIRTFIELLQNSSYFFNIKEMRLSKKEDQFMEGQLKIRAFVFEETV